MTCTGIIHGWRCPLCRRLAAGEASCDRPDCPVHPYKGGPWIELAGGTLDLGVIDPTTGESVNVTYSGADLATAVSWPRIPMDPALDC